MFPYPVYAFSRLVAEIGRIEIPAQEKHKDNVLAVGGFEVGDLDGLFLAALVDVGEIAGGFCFDEYRQVGQFGLLRLNHCVDGDLHGFRFCLGRLYENIHAGNRTYRAPSD